MLWAQVFWHSSAHVLGAAIESMYGAHLTIGPPLQVIDWLNEYSFFSTFLSSYLPTFLTFFLPFFLLSFLFTFLPTFLLFFFALHYVIMSSHKLSSNALYSYLNLSPHSSPSCPVLSYSGLPFPVLPCPSLPSFLILHTVLWCHLMSCAWPFQIFNFISNVHPITIFYFFYHQSGFYYDSFMGSHTVSEDDLAKISTKAQEVRTARTVRTVRTYGNYFTVACCYCRRYVMISISISLSNFRVREKY